MMLEDLQKLCSNRVVEGHAKQQQELTKGRERFIERHSKTNDVGVLLCCWIGATS